MHIWKNTKVLELIFFTSGTDYWFLSIHCKSTAHPALLDAFQLKGKHSAQFFSFLIALYDQTRLQKADLWGQEHIKQRLICLHHLQNEHYCGELTTDKRFLVEISSFNAFSYQNKIKFHYWINMLLRNSVYKWIPMKSIQSHLIEFLALVSNL